MVGILQDAIGTFTMNKNERQSLMTLLDRLCYISGEQDADEACLRCARRRLAEVLGLDLTDYRLMHEEVPAVRPIFYKHYKKVE